VPEKNGFACKWIKYNGVGLMSQRTMRVISFVTVQKNEDGELGPSICSTVDECDILLTDIDFPGYLTPGADPTEGGVHTVFTERVLERETR